MSAKTKKISLPSILAQALVAFAILMPGVAALAQEDTLGTDIILAPETPGAGERVVAEVRNFLVDLKRSEIFWFVNNKLLKQEVGATQFLFVVGPVGESTILDVVIKGDNGRTFEKRLIIRPGAVDLITEGLSYTPPFYKGRAIQALGGSVRVAAIPTLIAENGRVLSSGGLFFSWKRNNELLRSASGIGRGSITLTPAGPFEENVVSVEVFDPNGGARAKNEILLNAVPPRVLIYQNHPLYGLLFNREASGSVRLEDSEIVLTAMPFFFSQNAPSTALYKWFVNGIDAGKTDQSVTLRREASTGVVPIQVSAASPVKIYQRAERSLSIDLSESAGRGTDLFR